MSAIGPLEIAYVCGEVPYLTIVLRVDDAVVRDIGTVDKNNVSVPRRVLGAPPLRYQQYI